MDENNKPVRARAPLRLGLAAGGSDLPPFCDEYGCFILNATTALFVYAIMQEAQRQQCLLIAADRRKTVACQATLDLPRNGILPLRKAVYRRIMCDFNHGQPLPVTLTTYSDVPAGSGLRSSSTLVVAMIGTFKELLSLPLGEYEIAQLPHRIERADAGMP
jgi:D-glycero-alpha-D-manno-heptose-7-phosphate kinase